MANKKHYHYDKEQFVDREGKLYFLIRTSSLDYDKTAYHLVDIFNEPHIFSFVKFAELGKVTDTYKIFVEELCNELDVSHMNPLGFSKNIRNQLIHKCIHEGYKSIKLECRPSIESIGEVFGVSPSNITNTEKRLFGTNKNGL